MAENQDISMESGNDFNTDAFFNDGNLQQVDPGVTLEGLQPVEPVLPPVIIGRILDLQLSGCIQRVAWSRHGHIASISEDSTTVTIQCLRHQRSTNSWGLSKPEPLHLTFDEITSLSWSPSGSDLAIAGSKGQLSIFQSQHPALNRLVDVRQDVSTELDEMNQAIGIYWLNQDRQDRPVSFEDYLLLQY